MPVRGRGAKGTLARSQFKVGRSRRHRRAFANKIARAIYVQEEIGLEVLMITGARLLGWSLSIFYHV
jgi:hypothetical protein